METETKKTPERIEYLKSIIQRQYDHENWYGQDRAWARKRVLVIAAHLELLKYGIVFAPVYNCAI